MCYLKRAFFSVLMMLVLPQLVMAEEVKLIAHEKAQCESITRQKLRAIFTLRQQYWADGTPIKIFVLPQNHVLHQQFSRYQLGLYSYQLQRSWDRLAYSGMAMEPIEVETESAMLEAVKSHKGGIGYVSAAVNTAEVQDVGLD